MSDRVNDALRVLRECEWAAPGHRAQLKETLMSEFHVHRRDGRRKRLVALGVGVLALSSLGFVAVRNLEWVRVTLRTVEDGQVVERELVPDANGMLYLQMPTHDGPGNFLVQLPEANGDEHVVIEEQSGGVWLPAEEPQ